MKNVKYFVIALSLLLPFYLAFGQEAKQEGHEHSSMKEKRVVATVDTDGVQRVEVTGGEYYFDPNYIVVRVNVPVELKVKSAKDSSWLVPHSIVVKAPDAGIDFKEGLSSEPSSVKFTPTKVGKYPLYCDKKSPFGKSHRAKGMEGVIEVVE
ncbi:MAG TPA: quinol oxidase [Nitrospirota bacterium]|nr:quinol oxidase [Nitrospirota bacterium]